MESIAGCPFGCNIFCHSYLLATIPRRSANGSHANVGRIKGRNTTPRRQKSPGPVGGLKSDEAREALNNIHSLDRDEWAAAWSAIGDRYEKSARRAERGREQHGRRAGHAYFWAFKYYTAARWPVPNSPGKEKAYQNALAAFRSYGKYLDPPLEIVHIPFEGKQITGYIRLPKNVKPAPIIFLLDQRNGFAQGR